MRLKLLSILAFALMALPFSAYAQETTPCDATFQTYNADKNACVLTMQMEVYLELPADLAEYPTVAEQINSLLNEQFAQVNGIFAETFADRLYLPGPHSLYVTYEAYPYSDTLMAYAVDVSTFTGGAHPNTVRITYSFDPITDTVYSLSDLLESDVDIVDALASFAQENLAEQLGGGADPEWIAQGTDEIPDFANFALTADGLIIFFNQYQVAPYAAGILQVVYPLESLEGILKEEFLSLG